MTHSYKALDQMPESDEDKGERELLPTVFYHPEGQLKETRVRLSDHLSDLQSAEAPPPKPVPGSREALFLLQLLGRLKHHLGAKEKPVTLGGSDMPINPTVPSFALEAGEILRHQSDPEKKAVQVLGGVIGVYISVNGKPVHVLNLTSGAIIGGGESHWITDFLRLPPGLINLKVERGYIAPKIPASKSQIETESLSFSRFIDEWGQMDQSVSSYLSGRFEQLKQEHPLVFKYTMPVEAILSQPLLRQSDFFDELQIYVRQMIHERSRYKKGASIAYIQNQPRQGEYNQRHLLPALAEQVKEIKKQILPEKWGEVCTEVRQFLADHYVTVKIDDHYHFQDDQALPFDFSAEDLIAAYFPEQPLRSKNPENQAINPVALDALKFLSATNLYLTPELINSYFNKYHPHQNKEEILNQLSHLGLIEGNSDPPFLTGEGLALAEENFRPQDLDWIYLFSLDYFLNKEQWFFAVLMLEALKEQGLEYLRGRMEKAESLKSDLIQAPHPVLPASIQRKGLAFLETLYHEDHEVIRQIKLALTMIAHLEEDNKKTIQLAENYLQEFPLNPVSAEGRNEYIKLVFIYIETLAALKEWDKIMRLLENGVGFPDYPPFPNEKPEEERVHWEAEAQKYQTERSLWVNFAGQKARMMQGTEAANIPAAALKMARLLEGQMPAGQVMSQLYPLTEVQMRLSVQRLYALALRGELKGGERKEVMDKIIEMGRGLSESEFNPVFLQALFSNTAIAYRITGNYQQALIYHEKAATDKRGECRQLSDSSFILELTLKELNSVLETSASAEELKEKTNLLMYILQFLAIDRNLTPSALREAVKQLLEELNEALSSNALKTNLQGLKDKFNLIARNVIYCLNDIALAKIKQRGLSGENSVALGNCFDSLMEMKKILMNYTDHDGVVELEFKEFDEKIDLAEVGKFCLELDCIFQEHYIKDYLKYPPWPEMLGKFLIVHRLQLIEWLEEEVYEYQSDDHEYKKIKQLLYQLKANLLKYEEMIREDEAKETSQLWKNGWPEVLEDWEEKFGDFENDCDDYIVL